MKIQDFFSNLFMKKPSYEILFMPKKDMLYTVTSGKITTVEDLLSHAKDVDAAALRYGCTKVYNDLLQTRFSNDIVIYSDLMHAYLNEMKLPDRKYNIACVIPKEFEEAGKFWETACQNRGIDARIFFEKEEA